MNITIVENEVKGLLEHLKIKEGDKKYFSACLFLTDKPRLELYYRIYRRNNAKYLTEHGFEEDTTPELFVDYDEIMLDLNKVNEMIHKVVEVLHLI